MVEHFLNWFAFLFRYRIRTQTVTQMAIEEVAKALREGDLPYFMDHRPGPESHFGSPYRVPVFDGDTIPIRSVYREFLDDAMDAAKAGRKHVITHKSLFAVARPAPGEADADGAPENPNTASARVRRGAGIRR